MERTSRDKLLAEVRHFHNRDFLKAAVAVCALAAVADDEVKPSELSQIDDVLAEDRDYIQALQTDKISAAQVLYKKVRRVRGNHKRARTLMRVAYLVIAADGEVNHKERAVLWRICDILNLDPRETLP
jgi:tellurite resistance protein TerB